jgi:hypothetical protein
LIFSAQEVENRRVTRILVKPEKMSQKKVEQIAEQPSG